MSSASFYSKNNDNTAASLRGQFMATQMFHDLMMESSSGGGGGGADSMYESSSSSPSMSVHSNNSSEAGSPHPQSTLSSTTGTHSSTVCHTTTNCYSTSSFQPEKPNYHHMTPLSHQNYGYYYNTMLNRDQTFNRQPSEEASGAKASRVVKD